MHDNVLLQAFVYLAAAVAAVPLARRFGMGAVLGYLVAGIAALSLIVSVGIYWLGNVTSAGAHR